MDSTSALAVTALGGTVVSIPFPLIRRKKFMLDIALQELIKAAISIAKDVLGKRITDKNQELLERKKKKKSDEGPRAKSISFDEIKGITLDPGETIHGQVNISPLDSFRGLRTHFEQVQSWSKTVGFRDLRGTKDLASVYIDLEIWVVPQSSQMDKIESTSKEPLLKAIYDSSVHTVILGQPGAGKTTSIKRVCQEFVGSNESRHPDFSIPLLIRLRELNRVDNGLSLHDAIAQTICLEYQISNLPRRDSDDVLYPPLIELLDTISPLILLDGFDELRTQTLKAEVLEEFRLLCRKLKRAKLVLTCRSGEFNYYVEGARVLELAPLMPDQVAQFVRQWLREKSLADKFLEAIAKSPFNDTTIKPLSLSHLCAIYERIGRIPDRPKVVYRKLVSLLVEEWDEQRSITRASRYAYFEADRKIEFLSNIAFQLTSRFGGTVFSRDQYQQVYKQVAVKFGLKRTHAESVAAELESHTGIFIKSGFDSFEFVHKSVQEYLSAEYLIRLASIPLEQEIAKFPNELAIATSISSEPSSYLSEFAFTRAWNSSLTGDFYDPFISRLMIERPDLAPTDVRLTVALQMLLTRWVCLNRFDGKDIALRRIDALALREFIGLASRLQSMSKSNLFARYYAVDTAHTALVEGIQLSKARLRLTHESIDLPQYLLMHTDPEHE